MAGKVMVLIPCVAAPVRSIGALYKSAAVLAALPQRFTCTPKGYLKRLPE